MRICVIGNARAPHLQRWATAFSEAGHDVNIVSIRSASVPGVPVHTVSVGPPNDPNRFWTFLSYARLAIAARRIVRRCDPDVVHAHFTQTSGVFARAAGRHPIVMTAWGTDVIPADGVRQSQLLEGLNRWALGGADRITVASRYLADWVSRLAPDTDIDVVPFGVDTTRFRPRQGEPAQGVLSIGLVKSLEPRYGIEHAIRAMTLVRDAASSAVLTVVGEGSLRHHLETLSARLGLKDSVRFVGRVEHDDIPDLMRSFDILLNTTVVPESFGVVILEGAATGIPVITSDVGGVREVCVDGETALPVPPGDPGAIASAVIDLAADPAKRRRLGAAGRELAQSRFEWSHSVAQMLDILEDVVRQT